MNPAKNIITGTAKMNYFLSQEFIQEKKEVGNFVELSDHLGNVNVTLSDRRIANDTNSDDSIDFYTAHVVSAQDYFPFGMLQPGRQYNVSEYEYGFNGKLMDDEWNSSSGTMYDYGFRIYDPRIARFFSVDPLAPSYPYLSPYVFCADNPIFFIDTDGRKIKPYGKTAKEVIRKKAEKYGQLFRIPTAPTLNDIYETGRDFLNREEFNKEFKSQLKKSDCRFTKKDIEEAWSFYQALKDPEIIEVSVLISGDGKDDTYSYNKETEGSKRGESLIKTENPEYDEFNRIVEKQGGKLTEELANVLFKGQSITTSEDNISHTITPDKSGENWVFFKNEANDHSINSTKGLLLINTSKMDISKIYNTIINAAVKIFSSSSAKPKSVPSF